jgi:PHD/YefM family antitoxin component YafN of YafNO toxin-antitoxin module
MLELRNIRPVTEFNRNTKEHIQRLKKTGKPEVLTVNGMAEIVVQSAEGYQKLLDSAELGETVSTLRRSLAQAKRGESRPARAVLKELAATAGIELEP